MILCKLSDINAEKNKIAVSIVPVIEAYHFSKCRVPKEMCRSPYLTSIQLPIVPELKQGSYQGRNGLLFNIFMWVVKLGAVITAPHHLQKCKADKSRDVPVS